MNNKPLDEDSVRRAFQCAREIVLAYGPEDLPWSVRTALCEMLTHYENAALAAKPEAASEDAGGTLGNQDDAAKTDKRTCFVNGSAAESARHALEQSNDH